MSGNILGVHLVRKARILYRNFNQQTCKQASLFKFNTKTIWKTHFEIKQNNKYVYYMFYYPQLGM